MGAGLGYESPCCTKRLKEQKEEDEVVKEVSESLDSSSLQPRVMPQHLAPEAASTSGSACSATSTGLSSRGSSARSSCGSSADQTTEFAPSQSAAEATPTGPRAHIPSVTRPSGGSTNTAEAASVVPTAKVSAALPPTVAAAPAVVPTAKVSVVLPPTARTSVAVAPENEQEVRTLPGEREVGDREAETQPSTTYRSLTHWFESQSGHGNSKDGTANKEEEMAPATRVMRSLTNWYSGGGEAGEVPPPPPTETIRAESAPCHYWDMSSWKDSEARPGEFNTGSFRLSSLRGKEDHCLEADEPAREDHSGTEPCDMRSTEEEASMKVPLEELGRALGMSTFEA